MHANIVSSSSKSNLIRVRVTASWDVSLWNKCLQSCSGEGQHNQVLLSYHQMRDSGVLPNASTFPSLLRSCASLSTLHLGEGIHAQAHRLGLRTDPFVASSLVSMYASCQRLEDASVLLLDEMPVRTVAAWTALIQGHVSLGRSKTSVGFLFRQMQREDGISPNSVTAMCLFPVCQCLWEGQSLHGHVLKLGVEGDSLVGTSVAAMYMKCRSVYSATRVFWGLHYKNRVSWLVMVSGLALNGFVRESALLTARILLDFDLLVDSEALVNMITACSDSGDLECGMWVHNYIIKTGLELNVFVGTSLLNLHGRCGSLELARLVFDQVSDPNLVSWNSLMYFYSRQGLLKEFMELFWRFRQAGLFPDSLTVRSSLLVIASYSCDRREFLLGESFHGLAVKGGLDSKSETVSSILYFYAKSGNLQSAEEIFSSVSDGRDTILWNCMISGYLQNGLCRDAVISFLHMQSECALPDSYTFSTVLTACACLGEWLMGQCLHGYLMRQGYFIWDSYVATSLVDMYAKCGDVESAQKVFDDATGRDRATWNALIAGFGQNGYASETLALFYQFLRNTEGSLSSDSAIATAISACGQLGCLVGGRSLHSYVIRAGLEGNMEVGNALVSMYSKCGKVRNAELFFSCMEEKDTTSWTTMIAGYGSNGRVKDALFLFEEMITNKEKVVQPNAVTFLEVLWACAHWGLVMEGWDYFERMTRVFRIEAKAEHYCCMIDLLGRGGYLYEAYVLIRSMKMRADAAIWGALLGACRIYGDLELGQVVWDELSRAERRSNSYWVLLSNSYAAGGWWEQAARVRQEAEESANDLKRKKPPSWSCIEMNYSSLAANVG